MMLRTYIGIGVAVFFATLPPVEVAAEEYALVLANGQVMDPESGLNAIRNIAVVDGRIVEITELQAFFQAHYENVPVLEQLFEELTYRKTKQARALMARVSYRLAERGSVS